MNTYRIIVTCAATPMLWLASCNGQLLVDDEPGEGGAGSTSAGPLWEGNDPSCPAGMPAHDSPCSVSEGQICAYDTQSAGQTQRSLCGCWESALNVTKWSCYVNQPAPYACPSAQPENGSACDGFLGASCAYPDRIACRCLSESQGWSCQSTANDLDRPAPPASPDPNTPIHALSAEERAVWCDWFASAYLGEGYPEPPAPLISEDGYTMHTACNGGSTDSRCAANIPNVPSATCEANLALSTCEAPISELADCVRTVYDDCWPAPHGCARYFERPGCSGTIAISVLEPNGGSGGTASAPSGTSGQGNIPTCDLRVQ